MKKLTLILTLLVAMVTTAMAQSSLRISETLPGELTNGQYHWTSAKLTAPEGEFKKLRITFLENSDKDIHYGFPCIAIAEFYLYDKDDNRVILSANNFSSNATESQEGSLGVICNGHTTQQDGEGEYAWYWHSLWSDKPTPYGYHYLEINLEGIEADLSEYKIGWVTRRYQASPAEIIISTGATSNDACKNANSEMLPTLSTENKCIFYTIKSVRSKNYLTYKNNNVRPVQQSSVTENGYWYFTEGVTSGKVVMRNFATEQVFGENLNMQYGGEWFIVPAIYRPGCILAKNANDLTGNCIDDQGSGTTIGTWKHIEGDNEGTSWLFEPLAELDNAKENAKLILKKQGAGYPAAGSDARTALETAMNADDATAESIYAAIATYKATYDEASEVANIALPEAGKIYRIVSAHSGFAKRGVKKAIYSNHLCMNWKNYDTNDMSQLWTVQSFESGDTKTIKLTNVNDAMHPQKSNFGETVKMHHTINDASWEYLGEGQFKICANKLQGLHANGHSHGSGGNGNIINYNTGKNDASAWYLEEVDATAAMHTQLADNVDATYVQSYLIKNTSNELKAAVNAVKNASDEERATAFANLLKTMNNTEIKYIDEGYFYMKSKNGQQYAYNNNNTNLQTASEKTINSVFKFVKANDGTFYIQTNGGYYAQGVSQSAQVTLSGATKEYTIQATTDNGYVYYVLKPLEATDLKQYWHQDASSKVVGWSTDEANTNWALEPLSNEELESIYTVKSLPNSATITYNNEEYTGNKTVLQTGGFYMFDETPSETEDFTTNLEAPAAPMENVFKIKDNTISLFQGYNNKNNKIFTIRCVSNNAYARYNSDCQLSESDETNMLTYEHNNRWYESLFLIEEGTDNYAGYYTIRPLVALDRYAYNLKTADENSKVATMPAPAEGGLTAEYYWKITQNGEDTYNITPYHEGGNTGDAYGWNKRGSYDGKNHIGYWKGHNDANDNKWYVKTMEQEFVPHTLDNSVLGYATYESVKEYIPYTEVVNNDNFTKLHNATFVMVVPQKGAYYRLKNGASGWYATSDKRTEESNYSDKLYMKEDGTQANTIWYLDSNNALLSYTKGQYLGDMNGDWSFEAIGSTGNAATFNFGATSGKVQIIPSNGRALFGDNIRVDAAGAEEKSGNYEWTIEKVTTLPVTITAAGYASFYAPVAVELPDGVTAHTVTINTEFGTAKLSEGFTKIPANTGVILAGDAKTHYLTIIDEEVVLEGNNILTGTVAAAYIGDDAYVLSRINVGTENEPTYEIGFYTAKKNQQSNTSWLNNSHKAYLPKNTGTSLSNSLRFSFSGTTAIEKVESRNEKEEIYDLTGRKLECINGAGIYIVNGKKVLVK